MALIEFISRTDKTVLSLTEKHLTGLIYEREYFFLVYINDLEHDLSSDGKHFADNASLFTVVFHKIIAVNQLNRDLKIISEWAY